MSMSQYHYHYHHPPLRQGALRTQDVHTWLVCFTGGLEWSFSPSNGWICGASYPGSFSRSPRSVRLNSYLRQFQHPSCLALACTAHTVCLSHLQPVPCQINSNQIKYFQFIRSLCLRSTTCLIRLGSLFRWFRGSVFVCWLLQSCTVLRCSHHLITDGTTPISEFTWCCWHAPHPDPQPN